MSVVLPEAVKYRSSRTAGWLPRLSSEQGITSPTRGRAALHANRVARAVTMSRGCYELADDRAAEDVLPRSSAAAGGRLSRPRSSSQHLSTLGSPREHRCPVSAVAARTSRPELVRLRACVRGRLCCVQSTAAPGDQVYLDGPRRGALRPEPVHLHLRRRPGAGPDHRQLHGSDRPGRHPAGHDDAARSRGARRAARHSTGRCRSTASASRATTLTPADSSRHPTKSFAWACSASGDWRFWEA